MKQALTRAAIVLALGMAVAPIASAAEDPWRIDDLFKTADMNKDGMVTKEEFMHAAGMRFDRAMEKFKKMPDGAKYMKGNMMTREGLRMFVVDWSLYGGAGA